MSLSIFFGGIVFTLLLLAVVQLAMHSYWRNTTVAYGVGRIEKACDSVTSIVGLLIPATAAIATWLYDKTGSRWSAAFLALGTLSFLGLLFFTAYVRFNWLWGFTAKVNVGQNQNMVLVRWQASAMVLIIVGLLCLAIPTFLVAFEDGAVKMSSPAQPAQSIHNEFHNSFSYNTNCVAPRPPRRSPCSQPCSQAKPAQPCAAVGSDVPNP